MPHQSPTAYNLHQGGYPYHQLPYGQGVPNSYSYSMALPQNYVVNEKQKSYLDTLKMKTLDLKLKVEVQKMQKAKQVLEAQVYHDLKHKIKTQLKKQKYDLNDKNDLDVMDVVKRHQDHLQILNKGMDDNHTWVLMRENGIQHKKLDEMELEDQARDVRERKDR